MWSWGRGREKTPTKNQTISWKLKLPSPAKPLLSNALKYTNIHLQSHSFSESIGAGECWVQGRHFVTKRSCFFIHFTGFVSIPVPCFHSKFLGLYGCLPSMTPAHTVGVQCMCAVVHANGSGWGCDRVQTDNKMTNELFSVISNY